MHRYATVACVLCFTIFLLAQTAQAQEVKVQPVICVPKLTPFDSDANAAEIQRCERMEGALIEIQIPVDQIYMIGQEVRIQSSRDHMVIVRSTVEGKYARLIADPKLTKPMLYIEGSDYALYDLDVDGNKTNRDYSEVSPLQLCRRDDRRPANIEVHGLRFFVFRVRTHDAPCGSGLGVFGHGVFYVYDVISENNGWSAGLWPFLPFQYADGITVVFCNGGNVYNNILRDNTDFDLLFGGGKCNVTGNKIYHDYVFGFGGLNVGYMDTGTINPLTGKKWDGDHTGSVFWNNQVYSKRNMLMYGMSLGSHPFTFDALNVTVSNGGTFLDNLSNGAQINFAIDGVDIADVRRNRFENPQGNRTEFNACGDSLNYIAGHVNFAPQPGFVPMTIDAGRSVRNGNKCNK